MTPVPFTGKLTLAKVVGTTGRAVVRTALVRAGTVAGAVGVPWTKDTTWLEAPVMVSKTTCGTVTAVLMIWTVEEPGMVAPEDGPSVWMHGTVMVVISWMVVTGTEVAAGVGVMRRVVASVMMAGFSGTYGAQTPWKKFWALSTSSSEAP